MLHNACAMDTSTEVCARLTGSAPGTGSRRCPLLIVRGGGSGGLRYSDFENSKLGREVVLVFRASNLYCFATSAHPVIGAVIEIRPHFGCVHVLVEEQFVHC